MSHKKPTKEELEQNALAALKEAEELEKKESQEDLDDSKQDEDTPEDEESSEESDEDKSEKPSEDVDYKKKFTESTREAQVLFSKNRKLTSAIEEANAIPTPDQETMVQVYGDEWEDMSTVERRLAIDNYHNKLKMDKLNEVTQEFKKTDEWVQKVDEYVSDPKVLAAEPDLEGQEEAFKVFASKKTRVGADLEDLVQAFLYKNKPIQRKGKLLESGSTGSDSKPKSDKISIEEARRLRKSDYKRFVELLKLGKIEDIDI